MDSLFWAPLGLLLAITPGIAVALIVNTILMVTFNSLKIESSFLDNNAFLVVSVLIYTFLFYYICFTLFGENALLIVLLSPFIGFGLIFVSMNGMVWFLEWADHSVAERGEDVKPEYSEIKIREIIDRALPPLRLRFDPNGLFARAADERFEHLRPIILEVLAELEVSLSQREQSLVERALVRELEYSPPSFDCLSDVISALNSAACLVFNATSVEFIGIDGAIASLKAAAGKRLEAVGPNSFSDILESVATEMENAPNSSDAEYAAYERIIKVRDNFCCPEGWFKRLKFVIGLKRNKSTPTQNLEHVKRGAQDLMELHRAFEDEGFYEYRFVLELAEQANDLGRLESLLENAKAIQGEDHWELERNLSNLRFRM